MQRFPVKIPSTSGLRLAGIFVVAVSASAIFGWTTNREVLVRWFPGAPHIVMNTALGMLLCGAGALALAAAWRHVAAACGVAAALLAAAVLARFVFGRPAGIDEFFWKHQWGVAPLTPAGQMAPNAAIALLLMGAALAMLAWQRTGRWLLPVMSGVIAAFALVPLLGYVTTRVAGDSMNSYRGMALPAAASLLVLALVLLRRAQREAAVESAAQSFMGAAFGMLIAIGVTTAQRNADLITANQSVVHTYEVRGEVDHFVEEVARMESSMRAYGLTGEKYFRERAELHQARILERLDAVRGLVADNAVQRDRVARLRELAERKFTQSTALARAREEGGATAAAEYLRATLTQPDLPASALVILADEVRTEENRLLVEREEERQAVGRNARTVQLLGSLLALGLIGAAANAARRAADAREQAKGALRESEERFRSAFEDAGIGMALVGLDGRWLRVNRAICDLVGYAEQELLKKSFQDITHPDDLDADLGHVRDLIEGKARTYQMEKRYLRRDGRVVWVNLTVSIVRNTADAPVHFISQIEDITSAKQADTELRESEERFHTLTDAAFEGIVVSEGGRIVDANDRALELLGVSRTELLGSAVLDFVAPASRAIVAEAVGTGREAVYEFELRRKDGVIFLAEARARVMHIGQRRLRMTALRDVTARKQLESDLRTARDEAITASRLKSEFLATVSHELRTPMNGIIGMVDVLRETQLDDEQQEMARIVRDSGENLLAIICDILDFSKIEAGKLRIESAAFDLRSLIEETRTLLAPRAQERRLELRCELPPALTGSFEGDAGRIRQVLTNLVGNAIKFTERGRVIIRAQVTPGGGQRVSVRLAVEDTGIGIPPEAHGRLFQPFMQVDGSTTRRFGGTGLGLAISRQLVTLMGGDIGFTSEPGRGSTFWFELSLTRPSVSPLASPAPAAQKFTAKFAAAAAGGPAPARRLRLLVVEDNPAGQIIARMLLEKMGHTLDLAADGQEGIEKIGAQRYDAILMDCQMPVIDGYEVTRRVRAGAVPGADPRVPIIAFTAYAMADDRRKCLAAGMDDYVSKPVSATELRAAFVRCGLDSGVAGETAPLEPEHVVLSARVIEMLRALPGRAGPTLWPEMVALFLREEPKWLAEIERFATARSGEGVALAAHTFAGGCASLGALQLRAVALAVERSAQTGDWGHVETQLAELRAASGRLHAAINTSNSRPR